MSNGQLQVSRFMDLLDSPGGKEKVAQNAEPYIRDKLREDSFAAQIIPPQDVAPSECTPSTRHDSIVKIVEVEPTIGMAMPVTFRGGTTAEFLQGPRIGVPFYSIMSPMFEKTTQELLAYSMPLTKMVEQYAVKDIEAIWDYQFTRHIETCVQRMQIIANTVATACASSNVRAGTVVERSVVKGTGARLSLTDDLVLHPIQVADLTLLMNLLDDYERKAATMLITAADYNDIMQWTRQDLSDQQVGDTREKGVSFNSLGGMKVIKTIKSNILRRGNVYAFTEPDFLGKFFILNKINFWTNKIVNKIQFTAWGDIGMALIGIASIGKLELYSANVEPTTGAPADVAAKTPLAISALSSRYNRVDEGFCYTGVHTW